MGIKNQLMKRMISSLLVTALVCTTFIGNFIPTEAAEGREVQKDNAVYVETSDMGKYWSANDGEAKAPVKQGYVFAGWYTSSDAETFTALQEADIDPDAIPTTNTYAKFVSDDILSVKTMVEGKIETESSNIIAAQDGNDSDDYTDFRFLSAVDSTNYQEVGFEYSLGGKITKEKAMKKVWSALKTSPSATKVLYDMKDISEFIINDGYPGYPYYTLSSVADEEYGYVLNASYNPSQTGDKHIAIKYPKNNLETQLSGYDKVYFYVYNDCSIARDMMCNFGTGKLDTAYLSLSPKTWTKVELTASDFLAGSWFGVYDVPTGSEMLNFKFSPIYAERSGMIKASEIFGTNASAFIALDVTDVYEVNFDKIVYVRPYWVTMDGTKVMGMAKNVRVEDKYTDYSYVSVPVNLFTDGNSPAMIAGGKITLTYNKEEYIVVSSAVDTGRVLPEISYYVDEEAGTITIVANADAIDTNMLADGLFVNIRFQHKTNASSGTLDGVKLQIQTTDETAFCNWAEDNLTSKINVQ